MPRIAVSLLVRAGYARVSTPQQHLSRQRSKHLAQNGRRPWRNARRLLDANRSNKKMVPANPKLFSPQLFSHNMFRCIFANILCLLCNGHKMISPTAQQQFDELTVTVVRLQILNRNMQKRKAG